MDVEWARTIEWVYGSPNSKKNCPGGACELALGRARKVFYEQETEKCLCYSEAVISFNLLLCLALINFCCWLVEGGVRLI